MTEKTSVATDDLGLPMRLGESSIKAVRNSRLMRETRLKMLKGQLPEICRFCVENEKQNITSKRQIENKRFPDFNFERAVSAVDQDGYLKGDDITYLELRVGNRCNLRCLTCGPHSSAPMSSEFEKITKIYGVDFLPFLEKSNHKFATWFEDVDLQEQLINSLTDRSFVNFNGGEPMLYESHLDFLKKMIASGKAKGVVLTYFSNITIIPEGIFEIWKSFRDVHVYASIDEIEQRNNYIRYPSDWEKIVHNLELLKKNNLRTFIFCTVSSLNFHRMGEIRSWFKRKYPTFRMEFSFVRSPEHLSLKSIPENVRQSVIESYQDSDDRDLLSSLKSQFALQNYKKLSLERFKAYIHAMDQLRANSFSSTMPELSALLGQ